VHEIDEETGKEMLIILFPIVDNVLYGVDVLEATLKAIYLTHEVLVDIVADTSIPENEIDQMIADVLLAACQSVEVMWKGAEMQSLPIIGVIGMRVRMTKEGGVEFWNVEPDTGDKMRWGDVHVRVEKQFLPDGTSISTMKEEVNE
jgi:hypothetical protein